MTEPYLKKTFIRGRSAEKISAAAHGTYCALTDGQPLLLEREPSNPKDTNAVLVRDLLGAPCGYIAREDAPEISAKMASGFVLMAKATGQCMCIYRRVVVWADGEAEREVESEFKIKRKAKHREMEPTNGVSDLTIDIRAKRDIKNSRQRITTDTPRTKEQDTLTGRKPVKGRPGSTFIPYKTK